MRANVLLAVAAGLALLVHAGTHSAMAQTRTALDIYVIDVEGGNATLFVSPSGADEFLQKVYPTLYAKGKHTVVKPGDVVPIAGLDWRIVTAAGESLRTVLPGAGGTNPYCASFKPQAVDTTENAQSVGSIVTFGKFRIAHLGDLTVNKEFDMIGPNNRI